MGINANEKRAIKGRALLIQYGKVYGEPGEHFTNLVDLLSDLMHALDLYHAEGLIPHDHTWEDALRMATNHHECEVEEALRGYADDLILFHPSDPDPEEEEEEPHV